MINVGSDFSGVGAFNQALDSLNINYKTVFACDWDKYARETYIHNYGEPDYYPSDVYDRQIPKESLDIYMTSPPCQAFSLAGKRKGEKDKRGILFYNSHEFIVKNKPRYFIFENVKGLLSDDSGKTFNRWLDYLGGKSVNGNPVIFPLEDAVPYHIYHKVLNAKNYGVPQNRERVFIVGIRDDSDNTFTWPKEKHLTKRLKDVLEDNVDEKYYLSDKMIDYLNGNSEIQKEKGNGFKFSPTNGNTVGKAVTTKCGQRMDDDFIKVKSATKKGFEIANDSNQGVIINPLKNKTDKGWHFEQAVYDDNGITRALKSSEGSGNRPKVMIGAIRGRNPETPLSREVGLPTEQRLELNLNGTSNALTTVQKDNVVIQINPSLESGGKQPYQGNRVYDDRALSPTLQSQNGGASKGSTIIYQSHNYKIRRLTPRECFRLMDFPDTFTWPVSNSQGYKQAGNSIVVAVLAGVILKLN